MNTSLYSIKQKVENIKDNLNKGASPSDISNDLDSVLDDLYELYNALLDLEINITGYISELKF